MVNFIHHTMGELVHVYDLFIHTVKGLELYAAKVWPYK